MWEIVNKNIYLLYRLNANNILLQWKTINVVWTHGSYSHLYSRLNIPFTKFWEKVGPSRATKLKLRNENCRQIEHNVLGGHERCSTFHYLLWKDSIEQSAIFFFFYFGFVALEGSNITRFFYVYLRDDYKLIIMDFDKTWYKMFSPYKPMPWSTKWNRV